MICLANRRGLSTCGIEQPAALATDPFVVDCPLCHLMMSDRVPVVPGKEPPMRDRYADYVDIYATPQVDGLTAPIEFAREHRPARRPSRRVRVALGLLIGVLIGLLLMAALATVANAGEDEQIPTTPVYTSFPPVQPDPTPPTDD